MDNFTFENATRIIFGRGTETQVGTETARHSRRILLHTGMGSVNTTLAMPRLT